MSYYADAEGFIVAKDTDSYQKLEEVLGYGPTTNDTPFNFWKGTDTLTFNLSNADENYWDDEITDFLYRISKLICEGEVDYVGEDHTMWRFIFDADTQQWREESGHAVYGEASPSGLSDEDLIKEIQKRGYSVQKVSLFKYITETKKSNEGVFNSIVGLNISTADGDMIIDSCNYAFLTGSEESFILNLQYKLNLPEREEEQIC